MSTRSRTPLIAIVVLFSLLSTLLLSNTSFFLGLQRPGPRSPKEQDELETLRRQLHGRVERHLVNGRIKVNMSGPHWRLWRTDVPGSLCVNYETRCGVEVPRVWLVSFPGSGNTWTRYLLEAASGVFTGSVYQDATLVRGGYLGDLEAPDSGTTLVQKTHGAALYHHPNYDMMTRNHLVDPSFPAVLLLRHPAKALISYWKLLRTRNKTTLHVSQVSKEMFKSRNFHRYVEAMITRWEKLAVDRLLWSSGPLHVLHYELLLNNTQLHLRRLLHFLGVPLDERRLACVSSHLEGSFKRKNNLDFDPFTKGEKEKMSLAMGRVHRLLLLAGYQGLPNYPQLFQLTKGKSLGAYE
ncbi:WSCD family member AGAP003962 isoform X2 [Procambarus clarkii]|uniref:WSCD family member AGAP003962 isoform X2 n=1 Tax=Procambarus clarkii TaxID=6728 RepID=UPI003744065E